NRREIDADSESNCQSGHGVHDVITSRKVQLELTELFSPAQRFEANGKLTISNQFPLELCFVLNAVTRGTQFQVIRETAIPLAIQVEKDFFEAWIGLDIAAHTANDIVQIVVIVQVVQLQ